MICYLKNKTHVNHIMSEEDAAKVDCFYLAQNYFKLPRQTIRMNVNFICLFPQDLKNLNHIFEDHVGSDMTKEFRKLCKRAWERQHGFVIIDLRS